MSRGELQGALAAAIDRRADLLARLHAERTDCYRLLHGIAEDAPGVTLDRYGPLLLLQTFREPLAGQFVAALQDTANRALGTTLPIVCNHRGAAPPPGFVAHEPAEAALGEHTCLEGGVRFKVRARHRGQDPWLFLDLRSGRRAVRDLAAGKAVLNLFAYTCGVGVVAAVAGASSVLNVDFSASALDVGRQNARGNEIPEARFTTMRSDCIPVLRQLAGLTVQRHERHAPHAVVERRQFDLIVLDPPRYARGPFGTIDIKNDYQSLWKPCLLSLADGGCVLATNHEPAVAVEDWHAVLRRCAEKAGRPLRSLVAIEPEADFPSFDARPPLKIVLAAV